MLTVNPFSRPGRKLACVKALVVHWVENPGSTAQQNRNYFESLKKQSLSKAGGRYASAHFIVGLSGEVVQCLPTEEMAYHVGAKTYTAKAISELGHYPNNCTIGIELCHPRPEGWFTYDTWTSAQELCALLCIQCSLDPAWDIWRHYDVTRKNCPKYFVDNPGEFESFKQGVALALQEMEV
jgi:N-acetylmuramoyl-L-alanine amidase